jgi:hypothetical protein
MYSEKDIREEYSPKLTDTGWAVKWAHIIFQDRFPNRDGALADIDRRVNLRVDLIK